MGVAFFSAAQFLASLQWQNTAYKKNMVQFATRARTHTHTELYIRVHAAQAAAELQRAGTLENIDHMIFLPPPSTPPLPPPLLTPTQVVNKLVARIRL